MCGRVTATQSAAGVFSHTTGRMTILSYRCGWGSPFGLVRPAGLRNAAGGRVHRLRRLGRPHGLGAAAERLFARHIPILSLGAAFFPVIDAAAGPLVSN